MIFEKKSLRVVIPLDPPEGPRYTEPMHGYESDDDLDCIYKITIREEYWVNPTMNRWISWERKGLCTSDYDKEIEQC